MKIGVSGASGSERHQNKGERGETNWQNICWNWPRCACVHECLHVCGGGDHDPQRRGRQRRPDAYLPVIWGAARRHGSFAQSGRCNGRLGTQLECEVVCHAGTRRGFPKRGRRLYGTDALAYREDPKMTNGNEMFQVLLDQLASGQISRRQFLTVAVAAGLTAGLSAAMVDQAFAAGDNQAANQAKLEGAYDYIVVGAGASGAIIAAELSKTGAKVLIVESGGADTAPTISNPSIWFYNVGGPLDWKLPIAPVPQLNNRKFNMALGHVLGGGSSINALVWSRGMERDYDAWERGGAKGWGFKDVLPTYKAQEDWEGGANEWRGAGGPVHIRKPGDPHPTAPAFIEAARQMGFPVIDDVTGPMRAGAGYINMNIAADGTRVSSSRAFLRPNLDRPNLTLLLNTDVTKVIFDGDRASGVEIVAADGAR